MTGASDHSLALCVIRHCNGTLPHSGFSKTDNFTHPVSLELPRMMLQVLLSLRDTSNPVWVDSITGISVTFPALLQ